MARKVDLAKAKAAKQKKIAIGLGVLLVIVVAVQGPRTLKMLKGPSVPVAEATPAPVASPAPTPATPVAAPPVSAGAPAGSEQPAVLASSDLPTPGPGQLLSFERFTSKDPFAQQVEVSTTPVGAPPTDGSTGTPGGAAGEEPTVAAPEEPAGSGGTVVPAAGGGGSTSVPETPAPAAPAAAPATQTLISVNGVSGPADIGKEFPEEDPIFVLVSFAPDGRSVQIGIAGGTYSDGKDTITLKLGKPLTLQNTADGSRYELELESVAGFVTPVPKKK